MKNTGPIIAIVVIALLIIAGIWYLQKEVKANASKTATNTATTTGLLSGLKNLFSANPPKPAQAAAPAQNQQYITPGPGTGQFATGNMLGMNNNQAFQIANATQNAALFTAAGGFLSDLTDNLFGDSTDTTDTTGVSDIVDPSMNEIDFSAPDPLTEGESLYGIA